MAESIVWVRFALVLILVFCIVAFLYVSYYTIYKPIQLTLKNTVLAVTTNLNLTDDSELVALTNESVAANAQMQADINGMYSAVGAQQTNEMAIGLADLQAQNQVVNVTFPGSAGPESCNILVSVKADIDQTIADFQSSATETIVNITDTVVDIKNTVDNSPIIIKCTVAQWLMDPNCGDIPPEDATISGLNYCEDCPPFSFPAGLDYGCVIGSITPFAGTYAIGDPITISWIYSGALPSDTVNISLYRTGSSYPVASNIMNSQSPYNTIIPVVPATNLGTFYYITVSDFFTSSIVGYSLGTIRVTL